MVAPVRQLLQLEPISPVEATNDPTSIFAPLPIKRPAGENIHTPPTASIAPLIVEKLPGSTRLKVIAL